MKRSLKVLTLLTILFMTSCSSKSPDPTPGPGPDPIPEETILEKVATAEKFAKNYIDLLSKKTSKIVYTSISNASYIESGTYTINVDEDEVLSTRISADSTNPAYEYAAIVNDVYYSISINGKTKTVKRARVVESTQGKPSDYITSTRAQKEFNTDKEDASLKGIIAGYSYALTSIPTTTETNFVSYYDVAEENDNVFVTCKVTKEAYTNTMFELELTFNKDSEIISAYTKKVQYTSENWDSTTHKPIENAEKLSTVSFTFSEISYEEKTNTTLFDSTPYFVTSSTSPEFGYNDWETSTYNVTLPVGTEFNAKSMLHWENVEVTPTTACDVKSLYVTAVSDENIISVVTDDYGIIYTAASVGTVRITLGNSFTPAVTTVDVEVVAAE